MEVVNLFCFPQTHCPASFPTWSSCRVLFLWFSGGIQHLLPSLSAFGERLWVQGRLWLMPGVQICAVWKVHVFFWWGLRLSCCGASRQHTYAAFTEGHRRVQKYYVPNSFIFCSLLPNCFTYLGICNLDILKTKRWHCTKGTVHQMLPDGVAVSVCCLPVTFTLCLPHSTLFVLSHPRSTFYIFLGKNCSPAASANEADKRKHQQAAPAEQVLPWKASAWNWAGITDNWSGEPCSHCSACRFGTVQKWVSDHLALPSSLVSHPALQSAVWARSGTGWMAAPYLTISAISYFAAF